jgi:hypothetical protein
MVKCELDFDLSFRALLVEEIKQTDREIEEYQRLSSDRGSMDSSSSSEALEENALYKKQF